MLYRWKQEHLDELETNTNTGSSSPKAMADELSELRKEMAKSRRTEFVRACP